MSRPGRPEREDQRREWALWILVAADINQTTPREAAKHIAASFVSEVEPAGSSEKTEFFALDRIEDHLPDPTEWKKLAKPVLETVTLVELNLAEIDALIMEASPRWRIERMPVVDRALLRIGVAELKYRETPRPRATLNGLIEIAKQYGEANSSRFVNGIVDQIRKNLEIPFV